MREARIRRGKFHLQDLGVGGRIILKLTEPPGRPAHSQYSNWLGVGLPRVRSSSPGRGKIFFISTSSRPVLEPIHLSIQWVPVVLSLGVKRRRRDADHSPPSSADIKNTFTYTSTPTYVFMAYCLIS
jgi:hypothetical protein